MSYNAHYLRKIKQMLQTALRILRDLTQYDNMTIQVNHVCSYAAMRRRYAEGIGLKFRAIPVTVRWTKGQ